MRTFEQKISAAKKLIPSDIFNMSIRKSHEVLKEIEKLIGISAIITNAPQKHIIFFTARKNKLVIF